MHTRTSARTAILLLMAACATVIVYWNGLSGPFLLDDGVNLDSLPAWLSGQTPLGEVLTAGKGRFGRPLSMASFAATAALWGTSPFAYKLGNLLVHLLCGMLVFGLVRAMARRDPVMAPHADNAALGIAAVWLLHPLTASTVLYAVQRMAQLSALFAFAGMWWYVVARARYGQSGDRRWLAGLWLGIPLFTALSFAAKENGILLPVLCLALEAGLFRVPRPRGVRLLHAAYVGIPLLIGLAAFALEPARLLGGYVRREFDWMDRLLSQARALCDYLLQIVAPNPGRMGVFHDDFVPSTGLLTPPTTLLSILLLLGLAALAWRVRTRLPGAATGIGIFLAGHLLESTLVPLELYFEHRNYLPMVGVLYALAATLFALARRNGGAVARLGRLAPILVIAVAALLAAATYGRARAWDSSDSLAESAALAHPGSMRAQLAVVAAATARGDEARARAALDVMTRSPLPRVRAQGFLNRINLGCGLHHAADPRDLDAAIANRPPRVTKDEPETFDLLAQNTRTPCRGIGNTALGRAAAAFADAASGQPDRLGAKAELRHAAARLLARDGAWAEARTQARLAWQPGMPAPAAVVLVQANLAMDDIAGARQALSEARERATKDDAAGIRWLHGLVEAATDGANKAPDTDNRPAETR